ncbi:cobaltochelatase CobT-related protein [Halomonas huangheensis]|uniref:Cobalamin biosynthesis protein CobT VWA domain-containing protein n=1 Tax=Halomonas huangheensis TaxID=1178482 RepID=W1N7F1_9GAMM|nr:hypothetical protein [Halomonas huangheensis]ALM53198.1 hypothetical protein AR456_13600 [Halomonas huangheensis]ERL51439.1 hypothetical protein BJB45_13550 [Halomonas huangheensis]
MTSHTLPAHLRRQQYIEELEAAALRAATADGAWHYRARRLHHGSGAVALRAPHLRLNDDNIRLQDYRAVSDAMALRWQHSDSRLHARQRPEQPEARLVYDLLEQLRVESLISTSMPGTARNLEQRFQRWALDYYNSQLSGTALGQLLLCIILISWSRLMARPVFEEIEDSLEATRAGIVPVLGHALSGLRRERHAQANYQGHARHIADWLGEQLQDVDIKDSTEDDDQSLDPRRQLAMLLESEDDIDIELSQSLSGNSPTCHDHAYRDHSFNYHAFTTAYDSEVEAIGLVRSALLDEYRQRLDQRIAAQRINVRRLAGIFRRALSQPERDDWHHGEESGIIDGRRLAQIVSSPLERRIFQRTRYTPASNAQVAFLIDCSGSMKTHAEAVATLVELLTRALDMAGVATEVLGFTTGAWNGGRPYQEWIKAGRPPGAGRLNECRHLIFKEARCPWRRSRRAFGAMFKADLYREGIDGEALEWASQRLLGADVQRRLLVVISDGSPSDSATQLANDRHYLDDHLKEVIARNERHGQIEITGLGVGLDLSPWYRYHRIIDLEQTLDNRLADEVAQLLVAPRRKITQMRHQQ